MKKWIHLMGLDMNCPKIGIEGLTDYEVVLWLREAIRVLEKRNAGLKIEEYEERACE